MCFPPGKALCQSPVKASSKVHSHTINWGRKESVFVRKSAASWVADSRGLLPLSDVMWCGLVLLIFRRAFNGAKCVCYDLGVRAITGHKPAYLRHGAPWTNIRRLLQNTVCTGPLWAEFSPISSVDPPLDTPVGPVPVVVELVVVVVVVVVVGLSRCIDSSTDLPTRLAWGVGVISCSLRSYRRNQVISPGGHVNPGGGPPRSAPRPRYSRPSSLQVPWGFRAG